MPLACIEGKLATSPWVEDRSSVTISLSSSLLLFLFLSSLFPSFHVLSLLLLPLRPKPIYTVLSPFICWPIYHLSFLPPPLYPSSPSINIPFFTQSLSSLFLSPSPSSSTPPTLSLSLHLSLGSTSFLSSTPLFLQSLSLSPSISLFSSVSLFLSPPLHLWFSPLPLTLLLPISRAGSLSLSRPLSPSLLSLSPSRPTSRYDMEVSPSPNNGNNSSRLPPSSVQRFDIAWHKLS